MGRKSCTLTTISRLRLQSQPKRRRCRLYQTLFTSRKNRVTEDLKTTKFRITKMVPLSRTFNLRYRDDSDLINTTRPRKHPKLLCASGTYDKSSYESAEETVTTEESDPSSDESSNEDVFFENPIKAKGGVFHCVACNKNMSGNIPLQAHIESIKHRQLEEQWLESVSPNEPANGMEGCDATFCSLCDVHFSGPIPANQHYKNKHHIQTPLSYRSSSLDSDYDLRKGCQPCRVLCFSSKSHYNTHVEGQKHKKNIFDHGLINAPKRQLLRPIKINFNGSLYVNKLTSTTPRTYQRELFGQAMERRNAVIFLPTGTGKTLVAAMIIQAMLDMNPGRIAVFLVDKILLCIQQTDYFIKELKGHGRNSPNVIGVTGGGQFTTKSSSNYRRPLSQYVGLLVATAEYFRNMLKKGTVHWQNISLIVFDETHHCSKNHSYNMIMKENYTLSSHKPKIIGISATPAGRKTREGAKSVLVQLLANLGNAEITHVVKCKDDLNKVKSQSKLEMTRIEFDRDIEFLLSEFIAMANHCLTRLMTKTNLPYMLQDRNLNPDDVLNSGAVVQVLDALNELSDGEKVRNSPLIGYTIKSVSLFVTAVFQLRTRNCIVQAKKCINTCFNSKNNTFSLNQECLKRFVESVENCEISNPLVVSILRQLGRRFVDEHRRDDEPLALVMVQTRLDAEELTQKLNSHSFFKSQNIRALKLVGHGSDRKPRKDGTTAPGMSVSRQRQALQCIKRKMYQVIVATSVAEEGVDIPQCDLVILLYTPSSTTALVQLRGRARKRDSRLIILQNDVTYDDIRNLLENERNIEKVIADTYCEQIKRRNKSK
ncbi:ATP-dependent RNA helicase DHX58-like isoform X1 [Antedon mediterranea]|uniref:ATP-dependent RNA helicase DHX58-like isoform X1 n=1 Tax=Antedon mediterranea TaxID=105859 RepID=UPI003AF8F6FC